MDDVERIAAGLTEPQKRLLIDFDERVHSTSSAHHKVIHALYRKGLVGYAYTFAATFFVIQAAALRVAQHLKQENAK